MDVLQIVYILHHGNFYLFTEEHVKKITLEIAKRSSVKEGYNYAKDYPDEPISQEVIKKYVEIFTPSKDHKPIQQIKKQEWVEIFNRLFEMINIPEDTTTYFSGPKFIRVVRQISAYFPDYPQYIELRV